MKSRSSRYYILVALLAIALSQIMCTMPKKEEAVKSPEEAVDLSKLSAGVFDVTITNEDYSYLYATCPEGRYAMYTPVQSFDFSPDGLTLTTPDDNIFFEYISPRTYCAPIANTDFQTCIENLSETGYNLTVNIVGKKRVTCYKATYILTSTIDELLSEEIVNEALEDSEEKPSNQLAVEFSSDDCSFCGLSIPLSSSSASNNSYKMSIISGTQVEVTGHLTCDWQGDYKSENKTGTIMIYLNIYKFDNAQDAQILFNKFHNNAASMMPYCKNDDSCTIAIADFGEDRAYYVWENIYVGGSGELPSDHGANLARLITSAEKYYVLDLLVTHPELEIGNAWVSDTAESVEACVMNIINR